MRKRAHDGCILIWILLVVVGLVLVFGLFFAVSVRVRAAPIVREAVWLVDDQQVSTARLGKEIEARVVIEATEAYVGSIVVKIRKDRALWPDSDYHISTAPVDLKGGDEKAVTIAFTPDETSRDGPRGYFIEIQFRVTRTKWVMENSYPPRLRITN